MMGKRFGNLSTMCMLSYISVFSRNTNITCENSSEWWNSSAPQESAMNKHLELKAAVSNDQDVQIGASTQHLDSRIDAGYPLRKKKFNLSTNTTGCCDNIREAERTTIPVPSVASVTLINK
ncbi:hypothetical protein KY285_025903 [Solanum tuberosum]|nr:hypothetical protein KY285_025903 [Solanum tuberosum]